MHSDKHYAFRRIKKMLFFQMTDLETKLSKELPPEATVIACRFPFPQWKEITTIGDGVDAVWVYMPHQQPHSSQAAR